MIHAFLNRFRSPAADDALPGDFVKRAGVRGTGIVESIQGDHAVVAWDKDRRDILPLAALRHVPRHEDKERGQ